HSATHIGSVILTNTIYLRPGFTSVLCFHHAIPIGDNGDVPVTRINPGLEEADVFTAKCVFDPCIRKIFDTLSVFDSVTAGPAAAFPDPTPLLTAITRL